MNEHKDKRDLVKIISQKTGQSESITETFINNFFLKLSESIINKPSSEIEGLGSFHVIKIRTDNNNISPREKKVSYNNLNKDLYINKSPLIENNIVVRKKTKSILNTSLINREDANKIVEDNDENEIKKDIFETKNLNIQNLSTLKIDNSELNEDRDTSSLAENEIESLNIEIKNYSTLELNDVIEESKSPDIIDDKHLDDEKLEIKTKRVSPYAKGLDNINTSEVNSKNNHVEAFDSKNEKEIIQDSYINNQLIKVEKITETSVDYEFQNNKYIPNTHYSLEQEVPYLSKKKTATTILLVSIISVLSTLALVFIAYFILRDNTEKYKPQVHNPISIQSDDLNVHDTSKYSFVILLKVDTPIENIAEYYYGDRFFWPYIYYANKDFMNPNLIILTGSIIKIPKLTIDLAQYRKGAIQKEAEKLGNQIKKTKTNN